MRMNVQFFKNGRNFGILGPTEMQRKERNQYGTNLIVSQKIEIVKLRVMSVAKDD